MHGTTEKRGAGIGGRRAAGAICRGLRGQAEDPRLLVALGCLRAEPPRAPQPMDGGTAAPGGRHEQAAARGVPRRSAATPRRRSGLFAESPGPGVGSPRRAWGADRAWAEEATASPSEALLSSFERFLLHERGVALTTASVYVARARRFLDWCAPDAELASLTASDVTGAVLQESASQSVSATKLFVTALRSFLRYSFIEGLTPSDLSARGPFRCPAAPVVIADGGRAAGPPPPCFVLATADGPRAGGTTPFCLFCSASGCGLARWPACDWRTSTGERARLWCRQGASRGPSAVAERRG